MTSVEAPRVIVQWIGPGPRSSPQEGEPVPLEIARALGASAHALLFAYEDNERSRTITEGIRRRAMERYPAAMVATLALRKLSSAYDPIDARAALASSAAKLTVASPRARTVKEHTLLDPAREWIQHLCPRDRAADVLLSTATGTSAIVATLLSELADALADAVQGRALSEAALSIVRWPPGESQVVRTELVEQWRRGTDLLGRSRRARARVLAWAPYGVPLLLLGETGAGKTTIAAELHAQWWRREGGSAVFLQSNCSLLEPQLAAAELFGAKKGAFTGAVASRPGLFGQALAKKRATIFLDEFAELPKDTQAKLLTAIEPSSSGDGARGYAFTAVGTELAQRIPIEQLRLVLATNRAIDEQESPLRQDLAARVSQLIVRVAPLRETPAAIPALVLEAIEQQSRQSVEQETQKLTIADLSTLSLLLDACLDRARPWRFNHRDVRRLAVDLWMIARTDGRLTRLKDRGAIDREHVRAAFERLDPRRAAPDERRADPWTLALDDGLSAPLRAALEALPLSDRYSALLLVRALAESAGNAAVAWRLLIERGAFAPGRGAASVRNPSAAFAQRWRALLGDTAMG